MQFNFSLETLRKYRKSIEDQRRIELVSLREKQSLEEEKLCQIRDTQRAIQHNLRDRIEETKGYLTYLDDLSRQSIIQRNVISELDYKVNEARDNLIESSKQKKIIDKLRDKKYKQYIKDLNRQENKTLDEIVTTRFSGKDG